MSPATPPRSGEQPPPPPPPSDAPVIPGYRIVGRIGRGGMGVVYKAEQELLGRTVAIKALLSHDAETGVDQGAIDRLIDEGRIVARMEPHPNIAQVYDLARDTKGSYHLVMEFVNGSTLEARLRSEERFAIGEAASVAREAARALHHAHEHGIVHRDVKPSNIMLTAKGVVKVMDFGIARSQELERRTQTGLSLGTPHYMSPEQIRAAENLDARADVYSLAVVLYYAVCGRLPFDAPNAISLIYQQLSEKPPPPRDLCPQIPRSLEAIILKGMAKDRSIRHQSAAEFEQELADFVSKTDTKVLTAADFRASGFAWTKANDSISRGNPAAPISPVSPFSGVNAAEVAEGSTTLMDSSEHQVAPGSGSVPPETRSAAQFAPTIGMPSEEMEEPDKGSWTPPGTHAPTTGVHLDDLFAEAFSGPHPTPQTPPPPTKATQAPRSVPPRQATPPPPPRQATPPPPAAPAADQGPASIPVAWPSGSFETGTSSRPVPTPRPAQAPRIEEAPRPAAQPKVERNDEDGAMKPLVFQAVFTEAAKAKEPKKEAPKQEESSAGAVAALIALVVLAVGGYFGWNYLGLGAIVSPGGPSSASSGSSAVAVVEPGERMGEAIEFGAAPNLAPRPAYGPFLSIPLPESAGLPLCVAFAPGSPDTILAGCEDGTLRAWNAATGESIRAIPAHAGPIATIDVSPDGLRVLTGGADRALRLWEASTGRELRKMEHLFPVVDAAFSPDGRMAVATCEDGLARMWDLATGGRAGDLEGHQGPVVGATFLGRGGQIATGGADGAIRVWDVDTRRSSSYLGNRSAEILALAGVPAVSSSPRDDPHAFATSGDDKAIRVWDARSGSEVATISVASPARALAMSPGGARLASGHDDGSVVLWEANGGRRIVDLGRHAGAARAVAFSPAGGKVASVGADRAIQVWRAEAPGLVARFELPGAPFEAGVFLDSTEFVALSGRDGALPVWNASTGGNEKPFPAQERRARRLASLPDGLGLVALGGDDAVQIFETATRSASSAIPTVDWELSCLDVAPDGRWIVVGDVNGGVTTLDTSRAEEKPIRCPPHSLSVWAVAWSPDGKRVASAGADGKVILSEARTGRLIVTIDHTLNGGAVALAFSPDSKLLATGGQQGLLRVWDAATGDELRRMGAQGDAKVNAVAFLPDGRRVAAAAGGVESGGEPVRIWDVATGKEIASYRGHRGMATALDVSSDGAWIVSCGQGLSRAGALVGEALLWRAPEPVSGIQR
jgi:WD40 repeat protein/serine/threonine protein kinase